MAPTQKAKITLTDFSPKRLLGLPKEGEGAVSSLLLGVLIGHVTGTVNRTSPDGSQKFTGLAGSFELRSTEQGVSPIASGVLFMPDSFQIGILDLLSDKVDPKTGAVVQQGAEAVNFAYQVFSKRAGNPQGYEWALEPLNEPAPDQHDPLADMRALLPPAFQPAALIENKGGEQAAAKKK